MGYEIPNDHHSSGMKDFDREQDTKVTSNPTGGDAIPDPVTDSSMVIGHGSSNVMGPEPCNKSFNEFPTMVKDITAGLRFNEGKIRYDLLPFDAIEALAQHYTIGAQKYADRNWEKGFAWMTCFASLMRHLALWLMGEDYDVGPNGEWGPYPDDAELNMKWTGSLHITCVMWNAAALTAFTLRKSGTDDRQKLLPNPQPIQR